MVGKISRSLKTELAWLVGAKVINDNMREKDCIGCGFRNIFKEILQKFEQKFRIASTERFYMPRKQSEKPYLSKVFEFFIEIWYIFVLVQNVAYTGAPSCKLFLRSPFYPQGKTKCT